MGFVQSRQNRTHGISAFFQAGILLFASAISLPSHAQTSVNVQVDYGKEINVMTVQAMGAYTDVYDTNTVNPRIAAYMHTAGMYTLQFPGGSGSYADLYHWSTGGGTKYENLAKQDHFFPGEANMAHMVPALDRVGTALLTINYGSNLDGTGGGEPAEAAAWVAYINGDAASTTVIGKDSTGHDWKTVGYWATLRSQAPLPQDDGLNGLRANHPKPLNIKLWQIGSEIYNNGYYGGDHTSEEDLHAPYPASEADNEKRRKNPNLSPAFYGERVREFAKAMKAVDSNVWVGATLTLAPIDSNWASDWNPSVLKAACQDIEFTSLVWRPDFRLPVAPYHTRDDAATLQAPESQIGSFLREALYDAQKNCPAGKVPRIAITQMAPIHWADVPDPLSDGLFAADAFALLAETGTINTDWNELNDGYLFTGDNTPGPAFYGIQMLHIVAFRPGDQFVSASSSSPMLAAHAIHRLPDGSVGLMLINKDPKNAAQVKVNIAGVKLATAGNRFDYGPANLKAKGPVTKAAFADGGNTFSIIVPAYTITDIVLPKAQ